MQRTAGNAAVAGLIAGRQRVAAQRSVEQPAACVVNEEIPANRSGIINEAGTVGERFDVNIDWVPLRPTLLRRPPRRGFAPSMQPERSRTYCDCRCGEYRQFVRGHLIVNGLREPKTLWNGAQLEESTYHEDSGEDPLSRYGYRDPGGGRPMNEAFLPDRETGAAYRGHDYPMLMIGSDVDMYLQFKGQTYDRCLRRFGPIHEWVVQYAGPVNQGRRRPSPASPASPQSLARPDATGTVQRNIDGSRGHRFPSGHLTLVGVPIGGSAREGAHENVSVAFTPSRPTRRSPQRFDDIHFVQVCSLMRRGVLGPNSPDFSRLPPDWQRPLHDQMTVADPQHGVRPHFFVDQLVDEIRRRPRGTSPSPRYTGNSFGRAGDSTAPVAGTQPGLRSPTQVRPATMEDRPGGPVGIYEFFTSARGTEAGPYLGTVHWGFEIVQSPDGRYAVVNEVQPTFSSDPGATAHQAVANFHTYWRTH